VAFLSVIIGLVFGVPLGTDRGGAGGRVDEFIMRGNDLMFAFPSLLLAILITAVFGPGAVNAIIAIGIFNIPVFARVVARGARSLWTRTSRSRRASRARGRCEFPSSTSCPICVGLLVIQATIQFSLGVMAEAGLSYVGIGRAAADAELGAHAERGADADRARSLARAVSRASPCCCSCSA
jgi:peptide/nickel transport system permease protein